MMPKHVYCIGLGGVGVSAVAKYYLHQSVTVTGSDPVRSPITEDVVALGGIHYLDPDPARLNFGVDLVVYTDDCGSGHIERVAAASLGIRQLNFSEALGEIMAGYQQRIAIAGTNGKSTTTALTGLLLQNAGRDPTVFVGSRVSQFDGNLRFGGRALFVAEADEYRDHFLNLHPTIAVITNIELDHVNYFTSVEQMHTSFKNFSSQAQQLVVNADDPVQQQLFVGQADTISFGLSETADLRVQNRQTAAGVQTFDLVWRNASLGTFQLRLPGLFNIYNVATAVATALSAGADPSTFKKTVEDFHGVWRRFEILTASADDVTVVNDYAHHPTAVRATLEGAKEFYPGRRVVAVFQPHHHNRLTALFDDFTTAFSTADVVVISEVYAVTGRQEDVSQEKSGADLVLAIAANGQQVTFAKNPSEAFAQTQGIVKSGDVVIIMGAGDIWTMAPKLAQHYAR